MEVKEHFLVHLLGELDVDASVEGALAAKLVEVDILDIKSDLHAAHSERLKHSFALGLFRLAAHEVVHVACKT